jgi:hypothetical protein
MSDLQSPFPARRGLVARVQAVFLEPARTWDIIAAEPDTPRSIFISYVVPLAAIGPICQAIGTSLIGVGAFGVSYRVPWPSSLLGAFTGYALSLAMVHVMAFLVDALSPHFGGRKDRQSAFKLVAYAGTASYVAGIAGLVPMLSIVVLAASASRPWATMKALVAQVDLAKADGPAK